MMQNASSLGRKFLTALLTLQLAFGGVPAQAWASELVDPASEPQSAEAIPTEALAEEQEPAPLDEQAEPAAEDTAADQEQGVATDATAHQVSDATTDESDVTPPVDSAASQAKPEALSPQADDAAIISVSATVIGVDASGKPQAWAAAQAYELAEGATAADLTEAMFASTGLGHDSGEGSWGYYLNTITSPDGTQTLGWDEATGRYWQLFVNGTASDLGASSVVLKAGDSVCWCYSAYGEALPVIPAELNATLTVVGPDGAWRKSASVTLAEGATAADLTEKGLADLGLAHQSSNGAWGYSLDSITGPDGVNLAYNPDTWDYWQLFVNGTASEVGASSVALTDGMAVTWYYSGYGETIPDEQTVKVTCAVIGPDGAWSVKREEVLSQGATVADLTPQVLEAAGLAYEASNGSWGWSLDSITGPDGVELAYNPTTWDYWQLFVDGASSELGASSVVLTDGMDVTWCYSGYGESIPSTTDVTINPDATRPDYASEWSGYKGTDLSGNVATQTPTEAAELVWSASLNNTGKPFVNTSDPIIVNGSIYIAVDSTLYQRDVATGAVKAQAPLAGPISYTSRIRYADGLVLVPLEGGSVQAITADALATVWVSDEVPQLPGWDGNPAPQQNSSTIVTHDGYAYLGTTDGSGNGGNLLCLSLATGATRWSHTSASGYYWGGCAMTDAGLVVANDKGILYLLDPMTGTVKATLDLGAGCRTNVVSAGDGSTVYAVSKDGVLHKVSVTEDALAQQKSVAFAASSTTTPTIVDGKIIVAGSTADYKGTIGVVDLASMSLEQTIGSLAGDQGSTAIPGDIKSAPLVAKTSDGVYVYFTVNTLPGSLYSLKLGDALARQLFTPGEGAQNYCMSSPIAGADGTLYYTNDSATLFALRAAQKKQDEPAKDDGQPADDKKDDKKGSGDQGGQSKGDNKGQTSSDTSKKNEGSSSSSTTTQTKRTAFIQVSGNSAGTSSTRATGTAQTSSTSKASTGSKTGTSKSKDGTKANATTNKTTSTNGAKAAGKQTQQPAQDDAATTNDLDGIAQQATTAAAKGRLPIWPIVGMGCGVGALLWALLAKRRKDEDQDEEA